MQWQDLTSAELNAVDRSTPVFLSIGAVEQHGAHLPLSTDSFIGQSFLALLDARMERDILVLPPVSVGYSVHHLDYPGTLSVGHSAFAAYVRDIAQSALSHGFRNLVLFNSHAGNRSVAGMLVEELGAANPDRRIILANWWTIVAPELRALRHHAGAGDSHAGDLETSIMLHLASEAVRPVGAARRSAPEAFGWAAGDLLNAERATLYASMRARTGGSGVAGRPQDASPERGGAIKSLVIDALAKIAASLLDKG